MAMVIDPSCAQAYYDVETGFGDGGSGGSPDFAWIGIIQDVSNLSSYSKQTCRGIGSVDISAIRTGMKKPELTLKWIVQKKRTVATAFDPATLLGYAETFPATGLGLEVLYTYGATPSYVSLWFKGMMFDSLVLDWSIDSFVTATGKFVGQDLVTGVAGVGNSYAANPLDITNSYAAPLTGYDTEVFFDVDGAGDVSQANIRRVRFEIQNSLARRPVIQATTPEKIKYLIKGARELRGEITIYLESRTAFDYVLGNNSLDIMLDLEKGGNTPRFDFTGCKIDDSVLSTRLREVPCEVTLPFTATALTVS